MAKYILIFALYGGNYGGPATAEFENQSACEAAIVKLREQPGVYRISFAFCSRKH